MLRTEYTTYLEVSRYHVSQSVCVWLRRCDLQESTGVTRADLNWLHVCARLAGLGLVWHSARQTCLYRALLVCRRHPCQLSEQVHLVRDHTVGRKARRVDVSYAVLCALQVRALLCAGLHSQHRRAIAVQLTTMSLRLWSCGSERYCRG